MGSGPELEKEHRSGLPLIQKVSRRELLAGTAVMVAWAFVPASAVGFAQTLPPGEILTPSERQCLEAMVSRIIPADTNGPGALEAGCARYIESALAGPYKSLRETYGSGLAALNAYAMSKEGNAFATLGAAGQDRILSEFEKNKKIGDYGDSAAFFELVRRHTLEGMFGDPSYGGNTNFAGWDLIAYPGPRMLVSPNMQKMDAKIPRSRVSAKQLVHDSR